MRTQLRISYSAYLKNPSRKSAHYYARVRQDGKCRDIDLHTKDKAIAEAWCRLRRSELERFNEYLLIGEEPPEELSKKIVRVEMPFNAPETALAGPVKKTVLIDEFEKNLARRGQRRRTIDLYVKQVDRLLPNGMVLTDFSRSNVLLWLSRTDHLKPATRKSYSVSLREFAKVLVAQYGTSPSVLQEWPCVKVETVSKPRWTLQQMRNIIDAVECRDKVAEKQYKAYFWVMATCGSRQGETYALRWTDLNENVLTFRAETTKTNKTRRVPLDWRIARLLLQMPHEGPIMFSAIGRNQASRYAVLHRAIERSGMPMGNLHTFRHSASYIMYKSTKDIKATALMLGHSPATALEIYQGARDAEQLREVVTSTFEGNDLPDPMDDLIKAGLI